MAWPGSHRPAVLTPMTPCLMRDGTLSGLHGSHLPMTPVTWPQWLRGQCLLPKMLGTDL